MDFLTFLQQQATKGSRLTGPGTSGYAAAQLGSFAKMPTPPPPVVPETSTADSGGGFLDALNPFSDESDWGSKALDILSRPSYAMNNILQERARDISDASENGFQLSDIWAQINPQVGQAWQGLSGQQKTLGADVVDTVNTELGNDPKDMNSWVRGGLGLGIDIFADPTTYIGAGAIKSGIKAGISPFTKAAAKATDDMAVDITEAAVKRRIDLGPEKFEKSKIHPDQGLLFGHDEAALFDVGAGTKRVEKATPLPTPKVPDEITDQLDIFESKGPSVALTTAPKVVPDTVKIATDDVPFAQANATDRTKGMVSNKVDFSQMPVPTGTPLGQLEGTWMQPGSTNAYMRAGSHAVNNAEEVVEKAEHFQTLAKVKNPAQLEEAYKAGAIRPPINTPAERAFIDAVGITDLRKADDPLAPIDFHAIPDQFRAGMLADDVSQATVFGGKSGNVARQIPARKLWDILHGGETTADLNKLFVRTPNGGKVAIAKVVAKNKEALADPKFWAAAGRNAAKIQKDPRGYAQSIARQNIEHLRSSENIVYDDFKDWVAEAKKIYPDLSTETLKAAHDAAKSLLDEIWEKSVVRNPRGNVQKFMAAQHASVQIREVMAEAIARKAPPEELVTDIATVKHSYETQALNEDLTKILESSASPEAKAAAVANIDEAAKAADGELEALTNTASQADATRAAEAQQGTSTVVAEKARTTANFNEISPGAQSVIEGTSWGGSLTKDQAIGITRGAVGSMLKTMLKPGNYASFHQMNQTGMLNSILKEIGNTGSGWKNVIMRRGAAKSEKSGKVIELSRRVANLMKATEHQMDEVAGYMPNAWNGGSAKRPGYAVGQPGVKQTEKVADRANIPFSSSHLMDDMIRHDYELVAKGGDSENILPSAIFGSSTEKQSALWTKVVEAALFKSEPALAAIKNPTLRKYLLDYDPTENIAMASERYNGKVTQYIKAQSAATEKHVAETKLLDSTARSEKVLSESETVAKESIRRDPAAPVEEADAIANTAKAQGTELADAMEPVNPVATKMEQLKFPLGEVAKAAPNMAKANNAARNITRAAGSTPVVPGYALSDVDFNKSAWLKFKQIFQTQAGAETLRPIMQDYFGQVKSSIAEAAREWKRYDKGLAKATGNNPELMMQAIKSLDESSGYVIPAGTEDLVRGMRQRMENLLGGSGLGKHIAGNTSATKGAIPIEEINKWLKAHGSEFYFKDGNNWMAQWEKSMASAKSPQEAIHILHSIENAVKNAGAERNLFDDMAVRLGTRNGGYTIDHPYLTGVGFHTKEMALEAKRIGELVDQLQKPLSSNAILRAYDQALRIWKTGMTIYNPAHHIKNFVGDYWLLMADGGGIRDFKDATKLLVKYAGKTFDPEAGIKLSRKMKDIHDPAKLLEAISGPTRVDRVVATNRVTGHKFDDAQIMAGAKETGQFQSAGQLEDIQEAGFKSLLGEKVGGAVGKKNRLGQSINAPFAGKLHGGASVVSETRDHSVRLAHFIHGVRTSEVVKTKGMTDAQYQKLVFEDAGRRARTHHPDGLDLTKAERTVARRMIPFYSWQRKSIPVILQTAWKRPGLITAYPKAQTAVTIGSTGETPTEGFGTLPGDQMFPNWISENPWAVMGDAAANVAEGEAGGGYELFKGPSVPSSDLLPMLNDPQTNLGQLTPFGRVPAELLFGEEMATGIPIESNADRLTQVTKQIPGVSKFVGGATNQQSTETDFFNWLTGQGKMESGKYIDSAMWEKLDKLKELREANRG